MSDDADIFSDELPDQTDSADPPLIASKQAALRFIAGKRRRVCSKFSLQTPPSNALASARLSWLMRSGWDMPHAAGTRQKAGRVAWTCEPDIKRRKVRPGLVNIGRKHCPAFQKLNFPSSDD